MFKKIILTSVLLSFAPYNLYAQEPTLPMGLNNLIETTETEDDTDYSRFTLNGSIDNRFGTRLSNQRYQRDTSIAEIRLQTDIEYEGDVLTGKLVTDFIYDNVNRNTSQDFENGDGYIDLREANVEFRPNDFTDMKVGRQILTWGVGDLVFINDIFPKDWNSFFTGRNEIYLKAPSDAIKTSLFLDKANIDLVYMPRHDESRYIDGSRLSFFSQSLMSPSGKNDPIINAEERNDWFDEDEFADRIYKNIGSNELAAYYLNGFWKTPEGVNNSGNYYFPELSVYGASLRSPALNGILSLETGYYNSKDDSNGDNNSIRNSEFRYLIGYEKELSHDFTAGIQYYSEIMQDYGKYKSSVPVNGIIKDRTRELYTVRLTKMLLQQKLTLSLFNYYSPTDQDGYIRPKATYKKTDNLQFEIGGNIFWGNESNLSNGTDEQTTFFGQFEDNSNIYMGMKYSF